MRVFLGVRGLAIAERCRRFAGGISIQGDWRELTRDYGAGDSTAATGVSGVSVNR